MLSNGAKPNDLGALANAAKDMLGSGAKPADLQGLLDLASKFLAGA